MNRYLEDSQKDDLYRLNTSFVCLLWVRALKSYEDLWPWITIDIVGWHTSLIPAAMSFENSKAGISPWVQTWMRTHQHSEGILKSQNAHIISLKWKFFTGTSSIYFAGEWWWIHSYHPFSGAPLCAPSNLTARQLRAVSRRGDVPDGTGLVSPVQSCHHIVPLGRLWKDGFPHGPWQLSGLEDEFPLKMGYFQGLCLFTRGYFHGKL